jgi:hypothetical protein
MSTVKELLDRGGKKLVNSPAVVRMISNDRVMKVATGVLEARQRMGDAAGLAREAWRVLVNGHDLPNIDPSLDSDDDLGATSADDAGVAYPPRRKNG